MYCPYCNTVVADNSTSCPTCGSSLSNYQQQNYSQNQQSNYQQPMQANYVQQSAQPSVFQSPMGYDPASVQNNYPQTMTVDKVKVGMIILTILIPLVGIIAGVVNLLHNKPHSGKVYFVLGIVITAIWFIVLIVAGFNLIISLLGFTFDALTWS